jgi:hypothetical protein
VILAALFVDQGFERLCVRPVARVLPQTKAAHQSLPAFCFRVAVVDVQKSFVIDRASPLHLPSKDSSS